MESLKPYDATHSMLFEVRDHVMYITINLPHTRNQLDWRDNMELAGCYAVANSIPDLRAIVVTGVGDALHIGGLIHDHADAREKELFAAQLSIRNKIMAEIKVPLIVAVNGEVSGGGMSLLLKADIAIAAKSATFGYPEIRHGGFPVNAMVNTMGVLPKKLALQCFYFGDLFGAEDALRFGLVNKVVPDEDLMAETEKVVKQLLEQPAELIALGRKAYQKMSQLPLDARREYGMKILPEVIEAERKYAEQKETH